MTTVYNNDPLIVQFTVTDSGGNFSNPTGALRSWAVLSYRLVEASSVSTSGNIVTARFEGNLNVKGDWTVYLEETVSGTAPNIIAGVSVPIGFAQRPTQ